MKNPALFGVYGKSNSGKTTLIEELIKQLTKEKYKVATIKKSDKKIQIDQIGKDTWRHAKAGAELRVLLSSIETDIIFRKNLQTKEIIKIISELGLYDVILIEGIIEPYVSKVRVGDIELRENTIIDYKDNTMEIIKVIKEEINKLKNINNEIIIFVNEKEVPLSEFPASIIKNGIIGMLHSLKGVEEIKNVKIQFSTK